MLVAVTMERLPRGGPREVSPDRTPTAAELFE